MTERAETLQALLPQLQRRARKLCRDRDEAEDLAQETLLKLLQRLDAGAEISTPESYAMIILHNLARQSWRDRKPTESLEEDMLSTTSRAPGHLACAEIVAAIDRLPSDQACLMRQVAAGETSPARLAEVTDCPVGTVMSRLARARIKLRQEMGLEGGAPVSDLL